MHIYIFLYQDVVWGAAYEVEDSLLDEGSALNTREKTYQERRQETVYTFDGEELSQTALVFLGTSDEKLRLGPAPLPDIAKQVATASGPSGSNCLYLLNLAEFMHKEVPHFEDDHLMELECLVKQLVKDNS